MKCHVFCLYVQELHKRMDKSIIRYISSSSTCKNSIKGRQMGSESHVDSLWRSRVKHMIFHTSFTLYLVQGIWKKKKKMILLFFSPK